MAVDRTLLTRSAGKIVFGGQTLYLAAPIKRVVEPKWLAIMSALHGRVNWTKGDLVVKTTALVFGEYSTAKAGVMFPASFTTPAPGDSLCSDAALVIQAKNSEFITDHNAFVSGVPNIYLGIDKDIWASEIEFTSLIKSGANPEDAAAYYTRSTGVYADTGFALTNFKRQRYSLAWGAIVAAFEMHEGVNIAFDLDVQYDVSANYGTCNAYLGENGFMARVTGIPLFTSSITALDTADRAQGVALGAIASGTAGTHSADLVVTGSGVSITAKNAFLEKTSENFGIKELRQGPCTFASTSAFATGVRAAEIAFA